MANDEFDESMHSFAIFVGTVLGAAIVLHGWGRIMLWAVRAGEAPIFLSMALGMGGLLVYGGCINAAKLAFQPAVDVAVWVGAAATVYRSVRRARQFRFGWRWSYAAVALGLAVVGCFSFWYLTPQKAFNWHDDYERYFTYPVRMLETGTLGGNPLGYIGVDTFGGQAFLQAFVLRFFPIEYIGLVETGVCLLLSLGLAASAEKRWQSGVLSTVVQMTLVAIDPEIVNVASVYSTVVLVMTACYLGRAVLARDSRPVQLLLLAVVYAGVIALRTTNVVFVAVHFTMLAAIAWISGEPELRRLKKWATILAATTVFLLPWFVVHASTCISAIGVAVPVPSVNVAQESPRLFSSEATFYGVPQLLYTLTALTGIALLFFGIVVGKRRRWLTSSAMMAGAAAGMSGAVSYILLVAVLAPLIFGVEASTRYCVPILIGSIPAALLLLGDSYAMESQQDQWIPASVAGIALFVLFFPSLNKRIRQISHYGSPLAFSDLASSPAYVAYGESVLRGATRTSVEKMQALIPPRDPVIVWTLAPFWFNFARNPIFNTEPYGLALPRRRFPEVKYVIFQYRGLPIRQRQRYQELLTAAGASDRVAATRALEFIDEIERQSKSAEILFNDGECVLLRLRR